MWRVAIKAFSESPLVGVGSRKFGEYAKKYAERKEINPQAVSAAEAHNAYLEVLMNSGLVGFGFLIGMLFYPLYVFVKTYTDSVFTARLGLILIAGYACFSLSDHSPFVKGNFASLFLISMTVIIIGHLRRVKAVGP
jgi:O-antigen ligase